MYKVAFFYLMWIRRHIFKWTAIVFLKVPNVLGPSLHYTWLFWKRNTYRMCVLDTSGLFFSKTSARNVFYSDKYFARSAEIGQKTACTFVAYFTTKSVFWTVVYRPSYEEELKRIWK
jgi:hypothetical protein